MWILADDDHTSLFVSTCGSHLYRQVSVAIDLESRRTHKTQTLSTRQVAFVFLPPLPRLRMRMFSLYSYSYKYPGDCAHEYSYAWYQYGLEYKYRLI